MNSDIRASCTTSGNHIYDLSSIFRRKGLFTVQGPAQFAPDLDARMADPARRAQLLHLIRQVEQEDTLLGAAAHIACIAEKPTQDA